MAQDLVRVMVRVRVRREPRDVVTQDLVRVRVRVRVRVSHGM